MTVTVHQFTPTHERQRLLRRAFGYFGTGVTVVTVQTQDGPMGMTANSFSSISLEPPLILWSPAVNSTRHDFFAQAETFCVHVLAAEQLPLAQHFARFGSDFSEQDWKPGPVGAPVLTGCLAEFHCITHAVYPAGDHSVILGEVQQVVQQDTGTKGLMFDRGRFGTFSAFT